MPCPCPPMLPRPDPRLGSADRSAALRRTTSTAVVASRWKSRAPIACNSTNRPSSEQGSQPSSSRSARPAQPKATATRLRMPWAMTRSTAKPAARRSWVPAMQSANARWRNSMLASHSPTHMAAAAPRSRSSRLSEASESASWYASKAAAQSHRSSALRASARRSPPLAGDRSTRSSSRSKDKQARTRTSISGRRSRGGEDEWSGLKTSVRASITIAPTRERATTARVSTSTAAHLLDHRIAIPPAPQQHLLPPAPETLAQADRSALGESASRGHPAKESRLSEDSQT